MGEFSSRFIISPSGPATREDVFGDSAGAERTRIQKGETLQRRGIALVESSPFLRECLLRGFADGLPLEVTEFASLREFEAELGSASYALAIVSMLNFNLYQEQELDDVLRIRRKQPSLAIVVLDGRQNPAIARAAIAAGAQGYIPMSLGLTIATEAVRFVLAGGTYVPPEIILSHASPYVGEGPLRNSVTPREMLVIKRIQQGKPNKVIAFELNMCESTVKIHVRQIMKKLGARNRTDLAMKARAVLGSADL